MWLPAARLLKYVDTGFDCSAQAAFIHAVGDLLQSVGVMIAAVIIWYVCCCALPARQPLL